MAACSKSLAPWTTPAQDTDIQARRRVREAPSLRAAVIERAPSMGHSAKKGPTPTDPPHTPSVKSHTTEMALRVGRREEGRRVTIGMPLFNLSPVALRGCRWVWSVACPRVIVDMLRSSCAKGASVRHLAPRCRPFAVGGYCVRRRACTFLWAATRTQNQVLSSGVPVWSGGSHS